MYSSTRAVWRICGWSPSGEGPGASTWNSRLPPTPRDGSTATNSTTMPSPPSHWVNARHSSRPGGTASMSQPLAGSPARMVAPVVVRPLIASK